MSRFVVVVDAQVDFMKKDGKLYVPKSEEIVETIDTFLANLTSSACCGVLFTFDTHNPETYPQSEEAKSFPPHCYINTDGWNLAVNPELISPEIPLFQLRKGVFNMWQEDGIKIKPFAADYEDSNVFGFERDQFFENLSIEEGVNTILFVGVAADVCVKFAIEGAINRKFYVDVAEGCTMGIAQDISSVIDEFKGQPIYLVKD